LSQGENGEFARWATQQLAHDSIKVNAIFDAFRANLADRCRRVYEVRIDLREAFPYGLTPHQQLLYYRWLIDEGRSVLGLTDEEIAWYMFESAEDPGRGIPATYLMTPDWQHAVPHGLTRFGWDQLKKWLRTSHGFSGTWLSEAKCPTIHTPWDEVKLLCQACPGIVPDLHLESALIRGDVTGLVTALIEQDEVPPPDRAWIRELGQQVGGGMLSRPSVNVIGYFRYFSGLREAVIANVNWLQREQCDVNRRDIPVEFAYDWRDRTSYLDLETHDVTIINTGAFDELGTLYRRAALYPRPGVYRIAFWYWELETFPHHALSNGTLADEIWVPTEFIAQAIRATGTDKPVIAMLPGVAPPSDAPLPRERFGIDPIKYLFLFMFDMGSVMERKNPLGLIRAFRQAFAIDAPVQLAIKVSRGTSRPDDYAQLVAACREADVVLIDAVMTREESFALLACCDAYVSLHRSEGLGLSMAEAMLMGKPTIATGYSGNLDFMTPETSLLVRYDRVPLERDIPPYPEGSIWAEPDEADAARCMIWVYEHPTEAWALGRRGREATRAILAPDAAGARMVQRLKQIQEMRR